MKIAGIAIVSVLICTTQAFASDTYKVQVTRKAQDLYEVEGIGKKVYIKTAYCYEYATYEEAILVLESQPFSGSIAIGKLIFTSGGSSCQVDTVL
jgi:hypothetical protein